MVGEHEVPAVAAVLAAVRDDVARLPAAVFAWVGEEVGPPAAVDAVDDVVRLELVAHRLSDSRRSAWWVPKRARPSAKPGSKMTSRPCRPKKVLEVDIPHPRDYSVLTSRRFRELLEETSSVVHEEARKSFAAGEKEG